MKIVNNIAWAAAGIGYCSIVGFYDAMQWIIKGDMWFMWIALLMFLLVGMHAWTLNTSYKTLKRYGFNSKAEHQFEALFEKHFDQQKATVK